VNDEFVRAVAGKLPLFGKDKKLQQVATGAKKTQKNNFFSYELLFYKKKHIPLQRIIKKNNTNGIEYNKCQQIVFF
jgi:hypothetical protein